MFAGAADFGDRQPAMQISKTTRVEKSLLLYKTMLLAGPDILKFLNTPQSMDQSIDD